MDNVQVARIFRDIACILQIKGENRFRVRAYERAAQNIESLPEPLDPIIEQGRLTDIPGIGKDLSLKIKEYASTGRIKMYEELKGSIPAGLLELLNVPSIGPKTVKLLFDARHITSISDLEKAILENRLEGIFGVKQKTIENMVKGLEIYRHGQQRITLDRATVRADEFLAALRKLPETESSALAGSLRRQKETIGDIDVLVASKKPQKILDSFVRMPLVKDIIAHGETKASVRTADGIQVDCRVVSRESFGAALLYFTGSKNFNIKLRKLALKHKWKLNEYGIFKGEKKIAGRTEEEMFEKFGFAFIEPELREDTGEVEAAEEGRLPDLIKAKDLKGDLHVHSLWSDGANSIQELAEAAAARGYSYIAVTDHSQGLKVANGLNITRLKKKKKEIERVNKKLKDFRVLFGGEVDIGSDGALDYPDEILKEFDIVVAAVHSRFKQSKQVLTRRIIRACQNKYAHIIAHPTGRLWGVRAASDIDLARLLEAARDTNTALEINSFPGRLDLNDTASRQAKEAGVKLAVGSDSHAVRQLDTINFGISVARRGWLSACDVINTLSLEKLLAAIKK